MRMPSTPGVKSSTLSWASPAMPSDVVESAYCRSFYGIARVDVRISTYLYVQRGSVRLVASFTQEAAELRADQFELNERLAER